MGRLGVAQAERDTRILDEGDPKLLEMFDLEWRLDEISQYAAWFAAPHHGDESDRIALDGLRHELERSPRR
jgi:spectinomycin phosphotransferase